MTIIIYNAHFDGRADLKNPTVVVKFPDGKNYPELDYPYMYRIKEEPEKGWKIFVISINEFISEPKWNQIDELNIWEKTQSDGND